MPMIPAIKRPWEQQDGTERQNLHDLVRPLTGARDEDVEGADDRVAAVAGGLDDLLQSALQLPEALRRAWSS